MKLKIPRLKNRIKVTYNIPIPISMDSYYYQNIITMKKEVERMYQKVAEAIINRGNYSK